MKNIIQKFILPILVTGLLSFNSCSRADQKLVNNFEGTWNMKSASYTPENEDAIEFTLEQSKEIFETITFEKCEVKEGDCAGRTKALDGTFTQFQYSVNETADQITIIDGFYETMKIIELQNNILSFSYEVVDDNTRAVVLVTVEK